jgi:hypothetical protein
MEHVMFFCFRTFSLLVVGVISFFLSSCTDNPQSIAIPATPIIVDQATATEIVPTAILPTATVETIVVQPTNTPAPTLIPDPLRVQFAPGATSAVLTGVVADGEMDRYILGAQAGQEFSAFFAHGDNNKANISIEVAGETIVNHQPDTTIILPSSGDYIVSVHGLDSTPFAYELNVAISALASSPPLQALDYSARTTWISFLYVPDECATGSPVDIQFQQQNSSGITIHQIENDKYIIQLICDTFAYSTHSRLYYYDATNNSSTALTVPEYDLSTGIVVDLDILWGSDFTLDSTIQTFTNYQKGQGIGDCGSLNTYQFINGRFVLMEARYRSCDAADEPVLPSEWPVIYSVE